MSGTFLPILGQIRARLTVSYIFFLSEWNFFFTDVFFVQTDNSDCLADKFGRRLETFTIRHRGWLCGSNRRRLLERERVKMSCHFWVGLEREEFISVLVV